MDVRSYISKLLIFPKSATFVVVTFFCLQAFFGPVPGLGALNAEAGCPPGLYIPVTSYCPPGL